MSQIQKGASDAFKRPPAAGHRAPVSERLEQFERRQSELWRLTFFLLLVLSIVFALVSWDTIRSLAHRFEALPIGLVVLVVLFGLYAWKRTQEISELRGLVRGIEQREAIPTSEKQLDQLFDVISRSQQGYRDLIDSFDDILLAISLDGQIRAANRSFADLVGASFPQIVGHSLSEFIEEGTGDAGELAKRAMPRFLERRVWNGIVQIRLKGRNSIHYFDCVAHAMLRGDEVQGITVLGRDITALRKNEARFTELFESLHEGIYIATADDRLIDANPALARMLGYDSKEELLSRTFVDLLPDAEQGRPFRGHVDNQATGHGGEVTLSRQSGWRLVRLTTADAVPNAIG